MVCMSFFVLLFLHVLFSVFWYVCVCVCVCAHDFLLCFFLYCSVCMCICVFCCFFCLHVCVCVFSNLNVAIFVFDSILVTVIVCNSICLDKWTENERLRNTIPKNKPRWFQIHWKWSTKFASLSRNHSTAWICSCTQSSSLNGHLMKISTTRESSPMNIHFFCIYIYNINNIMCARVSEITFCR